jgi:membrane protein
VARWKFIAQRAFKGYGADRCSSYAAAIAYYALFSLFPLAIFAVTLAGYLFLTGDTARQEEVINSIMEALPLSEESGRAQLRESLTAVSQGRGGLGLIGLLGAAYSASALFGSVRTSLNTVFKVEQQRPLIQGKLIDLGMVFGLGTLLLLSLALTAVIAAVQTQSERIFGEEIGALAKIGLGLAYFIAPALVAFAVFAFVYKVIPHAEMSWRDALPGALFAAVGFEALQIGFAQYVTNFGNYDAVYGTLGFVIVFMFFAYLSAQIMLLGAELTKAYVEVSTGAVPAARPAVPKKPLNVERVEDMVKGLFVADEPHHDPSKPYEPAKPTGRHTDAQASQRR